MDLHLYFYFKSCAGLNIKYPSVIKTMFPLQALDRSICLYLFCLGECSLEALGQIVGENKKNQK